MTIKIGYLCSRGHFCFHADPDEMGACGSKSVGTVTLTFDRDYPAREHQSLLEEADAHLARVFDTWRNCDCEGSE